MTHARRRPHRHRRAGARHRPRRLRGGGARTRGSARRSASRSASTRRSSSCSPTWRPSSTRRACSCCARPLLKDQGVRHSLGERRWPSSTPPRWPAASRNKALQIHGGIRLLHGVPRRAPLPRRAHHRDLRGHERDPAHRHREPAAQGLGHAMRSMKHALMRGGAVGHGTGAGPARQEVQGQGRRHGRQQGLHPRDDRARTGEEGRRRPHAARASGRRQACPSTRTPSAR